MNKLCAVLVAFALATLSAMPAAAELRGSPFMPELDQRLHALETYTGAGLLPETFLVSPATNGLGVKRIARAVWNPTGVAGDRTVAAHGLGVTLPAKAIITASYFFTKTSLVSASNNGTIAFSCETANNILAAADIDATTGVAGQIGAGVSDGAVANMKQINAACEITATVAVNAFTGGKIDLWVEYVVGE